MGGDDESAHVYYGTPLVSEEELNPRKRKVALDQGQARQVAPWNQEVSISHYGSNPAGEIFLFQGILYSIS